MFNQHYCALSHVCLALYLHTNGFVHLQALVMKPKQVYPLWYQLKAHLVCKTLANVLDPQIQINQYKAYIQTIDV